jgi:hypothetical protein
VRPRRSDLRRPLSPASLLTLAEAVRELGGREAEARAWLREHQRPDGLIRWGCVLVEYQLSDRVGHWVYLIGWEAERLLKIGMSNSPIERANRLRYETGGDLELLQVRYCGRFVHQSRRVERDLHERYAAHRVVGEWFEDVPEIHEGFLR